MKGMTINLLGIIQISNIKQEKPIMQENLFTLFTK